MKNLLISVILLTLPTFASIPVEIVKIFDGDTVEAKIDTGNKFSIRFFGIDCYETQKINRAYKQAYLDNLSIDEVIYKGNIATNYLKALYKKTKQVSFDYRGIDKYGRVLGILYFDNLNINQELVNKGLCKVFSYQEK